MHKEAIHFIKFISEMLQVFFENNVILDVGGGDINGNNRFAFNNCEYHCNDVCPSENVTCVSRTKDLSYNFLFDTIISTECFEHDPEYKDSIKKIYELLKPNGLFVFTCASTGRPEHGTINSKPHQSYGTICKFEDMMNYYKNLIIHDLNDVLPLNDSFIIWKSYYNKFSKDLYFFGIKKGNNNTYPLVNYIADNVIDTSNEIQ